jgi:hypothetical protein
MKPNIVSIGTTQNPAFLIGNQLCLHLLDKNFYHQQFQSRGRTAIYKFSTVPGIYWVQLGSRKSYEINDIYKTTVKIIALLNAQSIYASIWCDHYIKISDESLFYLQLISK